MKPQIFSNVETTNQAIELLKSIKCVELQERHKTDKFGNESIKIVGMDKDFNILGYAIVELD